MDIYEIQIANIFRAHRHKLLKGPYVSKGNN